MVHGRNSQGIEKAFRMRGTLNTVNNFVLTSAQRILIEAVANNVANTRDAPPSLNAQSEVAKMKLEKSNLSR